jgi:hypothetical protein
VAIIRRNTAKYIALLPLFCDGYFKFGCMAEIFLRSAEVPAVLPSALFGFRTSIRTRAGPDACPGNVDSEGSPRGKFSVNSCR